MTSTSWLLLALGFTLLLPMPVSLAATPIHEIQGASATSPYDGQVVTVEGVVVGDFQAKTGLHGNLNGFFIQSTTSDDNPLTSEGLFVFDGKTPKVDVQAGDLVTVTGSVKEFFGVTELTAIQRIDIESREQPLPAPAQVSFPLIGLAVSDNDSAMNGLERYEGMRIRIEQPLTVIDAYHYDRFGELLMSAEAQTQQYTESYAPSVAGFAAFNRRLAAQQLYLDDGSNEQNPQQLPYPRGAFSADSRFRLGDKVSSLEGVLHFGRGSGRAGRAAWRLHPTTPPVFVSSNPRPTEAPNVGGDLRVASFNVLNFFTTLDVDDATCGVADQPQRCRGADSAKEYDRQLAKLVSAIRTLDADVLGVMEVENGGDRDALVTLVDAINAQATEALWAPLVTGPIGTDAIRVGIIYKPQRLRPVGESATLTTADDSRFLDRKNRPVLLQTFDIVDGNERFSLAVVHLKSKGSPCDDLGDPNQGDGQGNCNRTRTRAVEALVDWLATDPTDSGDTDVVVLGDFNAYAREDPIIAMTTAGYVRLNRGHSYVYNGLRGALDHAFVSTSFRPKVTGAAEWHINADEPDVLDYNLDYGRPTGYYDNSPYRASDHDPVVIGISAPPTQP